MKKKQQNIDQGSSSKRLQSANNLLPILSQQDLVQNLNQSIKKQIESSVKETANQSLRKVQFQTPVQAASNIKNNDSNRKDSVEEEIHFICGGNAKPCSNVFNDIEDYQLHIRKTIHGQDKQLVKFELNFTELKDMTLPQSLSSMNQKCLNFNTTIPIPLISWNVSSIKSETLKLMKEKGRHIFCLQEYRNCNIYLTLLAIKQCHNQKAQDQVEFQ